MNSVDKDKNKGVKARGRIVNGVVTFDYVEPGSKYDQPTEEDLDVLVKRLTTFSLTTPDAGVGAITWAKLFDLIRHGARVHGLNMVGTRAMCIACWPLQPGRITNRDGVERDWYVALARPEWDRRRGLVHFTHPGTHPLTVEPVAEAIDALEVSTTCGHSEADALDDWDWRSDLHDRAAVALAADPEAPRWAAELRERLEKRQRQIDALTLRQTVAQAAEPLLPAERVQACAQAAHGQGWPLAQIETDEASVRLQCGHHQGGKWVWHVWAVGLDGVPEETAERCHRDGHPRPMIDMSELLSEYRRVAAMDETERARYAGRRRPKGRRGSGKAAGKASATKAEPAVWDVSAVVAWLDGMDLPEEDRPRVPSNLGQIKAWDMARALPDHPPQALVREGQRARAAKRPDTPGA